MKKTLLAFTLIAAFAACKKSPVQEPIAVDPVEVEVENTNFYVSKIKEENNPNVPVPDTFYSYLGCGYDITGRYADYSSARNPVIDVNKVAALYPRRIWKNTNMNTTGTPKTGVAQNAEVFSQILSASIKATRTYKAFKNTITTLSDLALSKKFVYGIAIHTILYEKAILNLPLASAFSNAYSDAFVADINNLAPAALVQKYGTHVMEEIYLGTKLEVIYQAESSKTRKEDRELKAEIGLSRGTIVGLGLATGIYYSGPAYINSNTNQKLFYKTYGGDTTQLPKLPMDNTLNPRLNFSNWVLSSTPANSTLIDIDENNGLVPLYDLIFDPIKKAAVKTYIDQYIQENSVKLID